MGLDFDLDIDPETAESNATGGGYLGVGKHAVTLAAVSDKVASTGRHGVEFVFRDGSGAIHKETIYDSDSPAVKSRKLVIAERLGLLVQTKGDDGKKKYAYAPGKTDFAHCMGVNVVIELEAHKKDTRKDGSPKINLAWMGIHRAGDVEPGAGGPQNEPAKTKTFDI